MAAEEAVILRSSERRRILVDLYDTDLPADALADFARHIDRLAPRIVKLAVSADRRVLRRIRRALWASCRLSRGQMLSRAICAIAADDCVSHVHR